jgi:replication factor A1
MGKLVNFQPLSTLTPESVSRSDRKTIQQITNECTGVGDKSDYASVVATINALREQAPLTYAACTTEGCGKKVIEEGIQMYRCERCARNMDRCDHRYSFQIQIGDDTGNIVNSIKGNEWTFKLRAKQDTYGGETRIKYSILSVLPVDYRRENEVLMGDVERMMLEME